MGCGAACRPAPLQQKLHQICTEPLAVPELRRAIEASGSSVAAPMALASCAAPTGRHRRHRAIARSIQLQPQ
jgi:hypothetical protein